MRYISYWHRCNIIIQDNEIWDPLRTAALSWTALPSDLQNYACGSVSFKHGHVCQIIQRVGSRQSVVSWPPCWGLGVELTIPPWKKFCYETAREPSQTEPIMTNQRGWKTKAMDKNLWSKWSATEGCSASKEEWSVGAYTKLGSTWDT
jgi:hypothetical protein